MAAEFEAGYSGTPLARKLGSATGFVAAHLDAPAGFAPLLAGLPEDTIRALALPHTDLVDVEVCAIDATWSGLELMTRRHRR